MTDLSHMTTPDTRPGPYYVSAIDAGKVHTMAGPYTEHAAALADIMGADSRAVATALRKPTSDGRVSIHYKKGIGWYRFVRQTAKKGGAA